MLGNERGRDVAVPAPGSALGCGQRARQNLMLARMPYWRGMFGVTATPW